MHKVIFNQRLENVAYHTVLQHSKVNIIQNLNDFAVPRTEQCQIALAEGQFLPQRHKGAGTDKAAEDGRRLCNQVGGFLVAILVTAGAEHIQRVIQEVWVELCLQFLHFSVLLFQFVLVGTLYVFLQALRHGVNGVGNFLKSVLAKHALDAIIQIILANRCKTVSDDIHLAVEHPQQRRVQKGRKHNQ